MMNKMRILYKYILDTDTKLGVAAIQDGWDFKKHLPMQVCDILQMKKSCRRDETATVYALLYELIGDNTVIINHLANGRPVINGFNISISHTKGFVAVIVSKERNVSVDIEYISTRVCKIASRFMREDELVCMDDKLLSSFGSDVLNIVDGRVVNLLLHWCAKETLYKFYSDEKLTFLKMKVKDFVSYSKNGNFKCANLINNEIRTICYVVNDDFVLTYIK